MKLKEVKFVQEFDTIVKKERLILDIERYKYPEKIYGDKVTFYVNTSTGSLSTILEEVVRNDVIYHIEDFYSLKNYNSIQKAYSITYDEELKMVVFHLIFRKIPDVFTKNMKFNWIEFCRFLVDKKFNVYNKPNVQTSNSRRGNYHYIDMDKLKESLKEDGEYQQSGNRTDDFPFSDVSFNHIIGENKYINRKDGSDKGFMKEISNIFPCLYNITGNDYEAINSYSSFYKYRKHLQDSSSCLKKSGKKQEIIDELIQYTLPIVDAPSKYELENIGHQDIYKFAVVQKVPEVENTCVVRTFNYVIKENVLFEGGRIYVNKEFNFCKLNNYGEYVAQPLFSKVHHWDFVLNKFPEEETKGSILEYFGQILPNIEPINRSVAIWMFLKEPILESIAKISNVDFINSFIHCVRDYTEIDFVFEQSFGTNQRTGKKIFQVLGLNKNQFELFKDVLSECMPKIYYQNGNSSLSKGIIPFIKELMVGNPKGDISHLDDETFKLYYDFATSIFALYEIDKIPSSMSTEMNQQVLGIVGRIKVLFPTTDIKPFLPFLEFLCFQTVKKAKTSYSYNDYGIWSDFRLYRDYLMMLERVDDMHYYKPKFTTLEDLKTMHDNISLLSKVPNDVWMIKKFEIRYESWKKWEFRQDGKTKKDGTVVIEDIPFVVIAPQSPKDLVKEGTRLHHCVGNYVTRVAEEQTNVLFIRKKDDIEEPFFTVEVDNNGVIQQVHGLSNRNASSEPNLPEFIRTWSKARRLKSERYNKVR